ncbi:fructokinase [Thermanaeromonas toyohensis ToBE]|uniref:Fructokinase n=1 Tax=Thermanaeromonas toyohensis ToBE TaxID=698762 RepID=A0A1W1VBX3_9FIRM|nr:carbohydrate kinase [Thermanaeromonas toyohensis]SMB90967.1 fructokinase [Thermanaeromonas toyohensis ToBE]
MVSKTLDVLSIGEILIDFVGKDTGLPLAEVKEFTRAAGGGPANVVVGVARLGGKAGFIGKVGRDAFGEHLRKVLEENGVDVRGLIEDPEANTTLVFVALNEKAVPEFIFFRRGTADTRLSPQELPLEILSSTRILHFSSVSLTVEPARSATLEAVRIAREAGSLISFDPNIRLSLWPDLESAREEVLKALSLADVVKLNESELGFLMLPDHPPETSQSYYAMGSLEALIFEAYTLLNKGPRLVAVTLGDQGVLVMTLKEKIHIPAFQVEVVDTTGAGDAFMAGMLMVLVEALKEGMGVGALEGEWLKRIGLFGNAAAALTCTRPGVMPALPRKEEVETLVGTKTLTAGC